MVSVVNQKVIPSLVSQIERARDAYYNGTPLMSDAAYDAMEDELRRLDPTNPVLSKTGAPVASGAWNKVGHRIPMKSLNKAQTAADLKGWLSEVLKPGAEILITEKLDGISIALRYEHGVLKQALTRGDGSIGEDITRNVRLMQALPNPAKVGSDAFTGWVRGEIICRKSDFKAHFPGESNPRNTAGGTSKRQSDADKCKHLTVIAYQILPDKGPIHSKSAEMSMLWHHGFTLPNWALVPGTEPVKVEQFIAGYYDSYVQKRRNDLDYEIDGLVLEVHETSLREGMGEKNNRPAGAVAYKFPHDAKPTTLKDIIWQVGNSGRITPVAVFETVSLAGANVSRASMHNVAYYQELAAEIGQQAFTVGDTILVSRRNDVIPYVEAAIKAEDSDDATLLSIPTECPDCKTRLVYEGEYLVCKGMDCSAQVSGAVKRWVKKLGILDWGEAVIDALCDMERVKDPADLYTLSETELSALELNGRRVGSAAKTLLDNLWAKQELDLHVIIGSLGIPLIGRSNAKAIVDAGYDTLDKMYQASETQIAAIPGMGSGRAKTFVEGFEARVGIISKLLTKGVKVKAPSQGNLKGVSFCLTGFRDQALQDEIEAAGGTVKSSVSKGLDYLVTKDPTSTSGKSEKARQYGTKIIGIPEAWKLLGK